jgi:5'-nucleotidase / UDP-sugar diphosphatase
LAEKNLIGPPPGTLRIISGRPNPNAGAEDLLFLLHGDAASGPIHSIELEPGIKLPAAPEFLQEKDFFLSIYHFNDLHGHLIRYSRYGEDPVFSRMAWQIKKARQKSSDDPYRGVLALSAGDDIIGTIFDDFLGDGPHNYQVHASYRLYSEAGLSAAVLGNHDFDLGANLLALAVKRDAQFPVLAANVSGCAELDGISFPAAILVHKGIRVGVIGVVTPSENKMNRFCGRLVNPIEAVQNVLPVLRPLCDVVLVLSHLGYSLAAKTAPMSLAGDVEVAMSLPYAGVHLIVGGHSHHELNPEGLSPYNIVNGIPIVQAGSLGRNLGRVDLRIGQDKASVSYARLIPTSSLPVDLELEEQVMEPLAAQYRGLYNRSIGRTEDDPNLRTDHVLNVFASQELALANFITDAIVSEMEKSGQPVDFAMIDTSCVRRGLDPGSGLAYGEWFKLMPFADTIRLYHLDGRQIYDLLQDNVYRIDRPGEANIERGFLQFSQQIRYKINLGSRRSDGVPFDIYVGGRPLADQLDKKFVAAATNFTRALAFNWEGCPEQHTGCSLVKLSAYPYFETDLLIRQVLISYIQDHGGVTKTGGAARDGRLTIFEEKEYPITSRSLSEFVEEVSGKNHAMAGAVAAISAAQAAALGQACVSISLKRRAAGESDVHSPGPVLQEIQDKLLYLCSQDANSIARFVALREAGEQLTGQQLLCQIPAEVASLAIQAANHLQAFRRHADEGVRDDLEMSINLLSGAARTALLLLDSNLRIWPDSALLEQYDPIAASLAEAVEQIKVLKRIRSGASNE